MRSFAFQNITNPCPLRSPESLGDDFWRHVFAGLALGAILANPAKACDYLGAARDSIDLANAALALLNRDGDQLWLSKRRKTGTADER